MYKNNNYNKETTSDDKNATIDINKRVSKKYQKISKEHGDKLRKIGETVRFRRKNLKINSTDFSKDLGITRPTLKSLEDGIPNISLYLYLKALSKLGMKITFKIDIDNDE